LKRAKKKEMGRLDSEEDSDKHITQVPQRAKTLIIISALIIIVGFAYFWVLIALFTGSSVNPSFG
jgi:hypothetical protein